MWILGGVIFVRRGQHLILQGSKAGCTVAGCLQLRIETENFSKKWKHPNPTFCFCKHCQTLFQIIEECLEEFWINQQNSLSETMQIAPFWHLRAGSGPPCPLGGQTNLQPAPALYLYEQQGRRVGATDLALHQGRGDDRLAHPLEQPRGLPGHDIVHGRLVGGRLVPCEKRRVRQQSCLLGGFLRTQLIRVDLPCAIAQSRTRSEILAFFGLFSGPRWILPADRVSEQLNFP